MTPEERTHLMDMQKKLESIEDKLKVELVNGKKRTEWVNQAVQEIWTDIEVIRDINKIHRINKKYKVYWLVGIVIMFIVGSDIKDIIVNIIKVL